jgi:hypothetical protein
VTEDPREVSPLSRWGDVIVHRKAGRQFRLGRPLFVEDSTSIRSITDRRSLPPSSLLRCLISALCSPPSLTGGNGVTSFISSIASGYGRASRPVVRHLRQGKLKPLDLTTYLLVQA